MTEQQGAKKKGPNVLGALTDLVVLVLLLAAAGFGGYYWGTHQQLAPVQKVPPGTAGALPASTTAQAPEPAATPAAASSPATTPTLAPAVKTSPATGSEHGNGVEKAGTGQQKFWLTSSGSDYIGYSVTVTVNGTQVDNFFGPGKSVDITRHVKPGENTVLFEAKELGEQYNKHKGDESSVLTLHLVHGPSVQENYKKSDVLLTYKRNAAEEQDFSDTMHFVKD